MDTVKAVERAKEFIKSSNGLFDDSDIPAFVAGYLLKTSEVNQFTLGENHGTNSRTTD